MRTPRLPTGPPEVHDREKPLAAVKQSSSHATAELNDEDSAWIKFDDGLYADLAHGIRQSAGFNRARKRRELFDFLYANRDRLMSDKDIAIEHFGHDAKAEEFSQNVNSARVMLGEVREGLADFTASAKAGEATCTLPDAKEAGGYKLVFAVLVLPLSPAQCFWKPHEDSIATTEVISGCHLFLFNPVTNTILRWYDFNVFGDDKTIRETLKATHSELTGVDEFQPWRNAYLANGDVQAYESLVRYFHKRTGELIVRRTSRDLPNNAIHRRTPILVGRPRTNPFIKTIMESDQGRDFGYRIGEIKGTVNIDKIRKHEYGPLSQFPNLKEGVVGPITDDGKVFGIVTRMPNPSGRGPLTIIACDYYAMVIARIAEVLTDDGLAEKLLIDMKWNPGRVLPAKFELLFTVDVAPGGVEGEGDPQLIAWRTHDP